MDLTPWTNSSIILDLTASNMSTPTNGSEVVTDTSTASYSHLLPVFAVAGGLVVGNEIF